MPWKKGECNVIATSRFATLADAMINYPCHVFNYFELHELGSCTLFRSWKVHASVSASITLRLKCDGTRAETRFRLSAKRTSPFKSARASLQSTTGSRVVRINGSNAGYTMFRGSVKGTGYPPHSPVSPFTSPPVRHCVPSHLNWTLLPRGELSQGYRMIISLSRFSCP